MPDKTKRDRKRVLFQINADQGSDVFVAGTFNDWDPSKNRLKFREGVFTTHLLLEQGKHEYKFIVNGTWCVDPECTDWTPNGHGSLNSVLHVGGVTLG